MLKTRHKHTKSTQAQETEPEKTQQCSCDFFDEDSCCRYSEFIHTWKDFRVYIN